MTLVLLRHARVADGLCYGRADLPAEVARDQVDALASELAFVTSIRTSPLGRCASLASALGERLGVPATADARLVELSFGDWENRTWDDIERHDGARFARWAADWRHAAPPGGESVPELERRVSAALLELEGGPPRATLVVTHAGVIRALMVLFERVSWEVAMARGVPYLTPLRIEGPPGPGWSPGLRSP